MRPAHTSVADSAHKLSWGSKAVADATVCSAERVDQVEEDQETQEARGARVIKRPEMQTQRERDEHMLTHLPCSIWCPYCIAGRGISVRHVAAGGDREKFGVSISLDYCFITPGDTEKDMCPILILHDDNHEAIWAIPVEHKGAVQFVASWCVSVLEISGYSNSDITLKNGQEPANS